MFLKNKKVTKKLFSQIMKEGFVVSTSLFVFKFLKNSNNAQYAFVVSKAVAKKAILRNKLRRRGYSALRQFPVNNSQGIFFYKKNNKDPISFIELKKNIDFLLKKAKII